MEVMASIEITTRRMEAQAAEKDRLFLESQRHDGEMAKESDKNSKLVGIAEKKYQMDLTKIQFYLPAGKDHEAKLKQLEKKLVVG